MKFDIELPPWAKWLAQDASGDWHVYEKEPLVDEDYNQNEWDCSRGHWELIAKSQPPENWQSQLYEIYWE